MTVTNNQVNKFLGLPDDFDPYNPTATDKGFTQNQKDLLSWYDSVMADPGQHVCTIAGSAGSGKTFMLAEMIKRYKKVFPKSLIGVAAPTNKAVRILSEKLSDFSLNYSFYNAEGFDYNQVHIGTVHKWLRATPNSKDLEVDSEDLEFVIDEANNALGAMSILFVDECSMITPDFHKLITDFSQKVIYIGDPYQLFPVTGNKEGYQVSPTFDVGNKFILSEVVRYDGEILKVATRLRERMEDGVISRPYSFKACDLPDLKVLKNKSGYQGSEWYDRLLATAKEQYDNNLHSDYVRALVYKRKTREALNNQLRLDLYSADSNTFVKGEWLFTHTVCSSYIPLVDRITLLRSQEKDDPGSADLLQRIKDELIRVGNAWDLQVLSSEVITDTIPCPTEDLDKDWGTYKQDFSLVKVSTLSGIIEIPVLTSEQLKQFAANKHRIISLLVKLGYQSSTVMKSLKQISNAYNVLETPIKFVANGDQDLVYHNQGYGNYSTKVLVGSKIQSGLVLTVHQSQGSTVDHAFPVYNDFFTKHPDIDPMDANSLLYRLLYVALTRAKTTCTVFSKY